MKIKASELSGVALDWAVAQATGEDVQVGSGVKQISVKCQIPGLLTCWSPSSNWSQGGPLIERFRIHVDMMIYDDIVRYSEANLPDQPTYEIGDTPLQSACRAIVAAKLGDEVDVPEGLV